jgi:flavin-dependent dehydrogenase
MAIEQGGSFIRNSNSSGKAQDGGVLVVAVTWDVGDPIPDGLSVSVTKNTSSEFKATYTIQASGKAGAAGRKVLDKKLSPKKTATVRIAWASATGHEITTEIPPDEFTW